MGIESFQSQDNKNQTNCQGGWGRVFPGPLMPRAASHPSRDAESKVRVQGGAEGEHRWAPDIPVLIDGELGQVIGMVRRVDCAQRLQAPVLQPSPAEKEVDEEAADLGPVDS